MLNLGLESSVIQAVVLYMNLKLQDIIFLNVKPKAREYNIKLKLNVLPITENFTQNWQLNSNILLGGNGEF